MRILSSEMFKARSLFFILLVVLLPVIYIVSLLVYNYQDNAALQDSSINRYKQDVEKQAATLGYFFLERKYDIRAMANSLEIGTYFANRAMGMSLQYGLKVSLFSIRQMMLETIKNKSIDKDSIYKRFVFVELNKNILVSTESPVSANKVLHSNTKLDDIQNEPELILQETEHGYKILLATPCFFKQKVSGWISADLDLNVLHTHFMGSSLDASSKVFNLTLENGTIIDQSDTTNPNLPWESFQNKIAGLTGLDLLPVTGLPDETGPFLFSRIQIHTLPLFLTAYVEKSEILGNLGKWPFLAGVGALIVLIVLGLFLFLNTNTKHLILTARVDESKKQQNLLAAKNSQLEDEIIRREQAEQFLKENEERYRKLFEFSSDAILIMKESTIIVCNQKTAELLRLDREKIINKDLFTFTPTIQPNGKVSTTECMIKISEAVSQPQRFEWTLKTPDNRPIDVEISMAVLSLNADTLSQVIIRDITQQKRTQEILVQTEKMMAVGGLAAGMAHEINNPLGVILQANQNIGRRLGTTLKKNKETALSMGLDFDKFQKYLQEKSINTYVESIQAAGERAAKIVKSMLDFGRASESSNKQPCNVNEILDNTIDMVSADYDLKKKFDFRNIEINRLYSDIDIIMCEKTEIGQVFLNIFKNAAHAMHISSTEKPLLTIRTDQTLEGIRIKIEDNGPGISKHDQKQIFEPFFTTKPVNEGTGLGLSVSYFIITAHHGGKVRVESEKGQGTRFIIELPKQ